MASLEHWCRYISGNQWIGICWSSRVWRMISDVTGDPFGSGLGASAYGISLSHWGRSVAPSSRHRSPTHGGVRRPVFVRGRLVQRLSHVTVRVHTRSPLGSGDHPLHALLGGRGYETLRVGLSCFLRVWALVSVYVVPADDDPLAGVDLVPAALAPAHALGLACTADARGLLHVHGSPDPALHGITSTR